MRIYLLKQKHIQAYLSLAFFILCSFSFVPLHASDDVCNAQTITVDAPPITGDNTGATAQANEVTSACTDAEHTLWYQFTPPSTCAVRISTDFPNTSLHDTEIALYTATDCNDFSTFTFLKCDQDSGNAAPSGYTSVIEESNLIAGQTYYIQVNGWNSGQGEFMIEVTSLAGTCPCDTPMATYTVVEDCANSQFTVNVDISSLGFATAVDILNDAGLAPTTNVGAGQYMVGPFTPETFVTVTVDGSNYGGCDIMSSALNGCLNSICERARDLSSLPLSGDNNLASSDATNCGGNSVDNGLWYTFVGNGNDVTLIITGTNGYSDVQGAIYSGSCDALNCIDDIGGESQTEASRTIIATEMGTNYYIIVDGYTGIHGTYNIVAEGLTVLPIELSSFSAYPLDDVNRIEWTTSSEINTAWMIIERSINGRDNWKEVEKIAAKGHSTVEQSYSLIDVQPLTVAYYRLVSVDANGEEHFSDIVEVQRKGKDISVMNIYPVPTQDVVYLQVLSPINKQQNLLLTDMFGRTLDIQQLNILEGVHHYPIDLQPFANGVYFISLELNGQRVVHKIVKE